jgi:hypothetical protein
MASVITKAAEIWGSAPGGMPAANDAANRSAADCTRYLSPCVVAVVVISTWGLVWLREERRSPAAEHT